MSEGSLEAAEGPPSPADAARARQKAVTRQLDEQSNRRVQRLGRAVGVWGLGWTVLLGLGCAGLALVVLWALMSSGMMSRAMSLVIAVGGALLLIHAARVRVATRHLPAARARARVRAGRCGACDYPLDGLAAADDGCCICPECGSGWRVPEAF